MSHPIEAPTPAHAHGWTPERKALFLDRLAAHGNARAACRAVGLSAEAAYRLRRRDALFARGWAAALLLARENGVQVLGERAIEGVEEEIYYRGELIGTRRRYDSRLLLAHLARLDKLADEAGAGADAGRFDELVACIAERADDLPEGTREQYIEQAAAYADNRLRREEMDAYYDSLEEDEEGMAESSYWDRPVDEAFQDELERKCQALATQVRQAAADGWDNFRAQAIAAVDALCATQYCAEPETPLPPALASIVSPPRTQVAPELFPWTMSTASTSALARSLADPPPSFAPTPRSPFTARRKPVQR